MYGGDGFWMFADPTDPDYIYAESQGGYIGRVNRNTHETRDIQPLAALQGRSCASTGTRRSTSARREGHALHRRAVPLPLARPRPDLGAHLARSDHQRSGEAEAGAVGRRHRRQLRRRDAHDDLLDQRVAARTRSVIWVGTDDGNVQVTRDGGKTLDERRRQRAGRAEERLGVVGRGRAASTRARRTRRSTATPSAT